MHGWSSRAATGSKAPSAPSLPPTSRPTAQAGIGGWSTEAFATALLHGTSPDGGHYYPALALWLLFPHDRRDDAVDLKAFIDTLPG
jgi:hypothetical protein